MYVVGRVTSMGFQLFDKFAEMIDRLPAKAVVNAVQLEKEMLESDLAQKRTLPMAEVCLICCLL